MAVKKKISNIDFLIVSSFSSFLKPCFLSKASGHDYDAVDNPDKLGQREAQPSMMLHHVSLQLPPELFLYAYLC